MKTDIFCSLNMSTIVVDPYCVSRTDMIKWNLSGFGLWCFNATFNNISVISWRSILL